MRPAPRQHARRDSGFTLLELLVVIGILAVLMGLGVAGYMGLRQNLRGEGALSRLESTLRTARHTALYSRTFSQVRIDKKEKSVYAIGFKTLGLWHFEDSSLTGAFGIDATVSGGKQSPLGKVGSGVKLEGARGSEIQLGSRYGFRNGGHVEAFFFKLPSQSKQILFAKGTHLALSLDETGLIYATAGKTSCNSGTYSLPSHRWSKVAVQWITRGKGKDAETEVSILVDDVLRGAAKGSGVVTSKKPLTVGSGKLPFNGYVDEVRVLGAVHSDPWPWPDDMSTKLMSQDVTSIHFDQQGHLDPRHHGGSVNLAFVHDGQKLYRMRIGMVGTVQEIAKSKYNPQAVQQELKKKKKSGKKKSSSKGKSKRGSKK